jgi:hypothetical protein
MAMDFFESTALHVRADHSGTLAFHAKLSINSSDFSPLSHATAEER